MRKFKMLILTDHINHSAVNSLYKLANALNNNPRCAYIDIATRGFELNDPFYKKHQTEDIFVRRMDEELVFHPEGKVFKEKLHQESLSTYDVVLLRLPPPITNDFAHFLIKQFPKQLWINHPLSIIRTGNKQFLLNFPDLCPRMKLCTTIEDIVSFKNQHPIVLKPLQDYGGNGIIRIDEDQVWEGNQKTDWPKLSLQLADQPFEYLAVEYLHHVDQGDKRIIVINGEVVGTSLRLPAKDSWLCNAAMGGRSELSEPDANELEILNRVDQLLSKIGVVMYGIDTLMGNNGKRVLSEINTTSIGGLAPISELTNRPVIQQAADLLWHYIISKRTIHVDTNI